MVLLEAMVAGVPVICTSCGGGREVVEDVGLLFPLGQPDVLARRLIELSQFSREQASSCRAAMQQRLLDHFSDPVVRRRFWAMPVMNPFH